MPKFSVFQDFTAFRFSAKPTHGEAIYRSMISSVEKAFDVSEGSYEEARIYGQAMGLARARYSLERALNQHIPKKTIELLPKVEFDWSCIPGPYDGIVARQDALDAKVKLPRGARRDNIESILRDIYGDDFIAYRVTAPTEVVSWPPDPWTGPGTFKREDESVLPKYFSMITPVVLFSDPADANSFSKVYYETLQDNDPAFLSEGDVVTVQVENISLAEQVTVLSAGEDSIGKFFTAKFVRCHDVGSSVVFGTVPVWFSNQRFVLIVVKSVAASDLTKWRKVNEVMDRVSRSVTGWAVVEPVSAGSAQIGPYTLNVSRLGLTTIGQIDINPTVSGVPSTQPPDPEFVYPQSGSTLGGTNAYVFGHGFAGTTSVTFDGVAATIVEVTDKRIRCTTPAHATAWTDVVVTTPAGSKTLVQGFRYE